MPTTGHQGELGAEGSAHLVASIPQVLQGQPLALSMKETDQSLQRGKKRGLSGDWPCAEDLWIQKAWGVRSQGKATSQI